MKSYEIKTIASAKFVIFSTVLLLSLMVALGFLSAYVYVYLFYILFLPVLIGSGYLGILLASRKIQIVLNKTHFTFDGKKIEFSEIDAYFTKFSKLTQLEIMSLLQLKLTTGEIINTTFSNFGERSKIEKEVLLNLIKVATQSNSEIQKVDVLMMKKKNYNILRIINITLLVIVIIIDICYFTALIFGKIEFNYKFLIVNVFALSAIPYLKRNK